MSAARISSIQLSPEASQLDPASGEVKIKVGLEDGSSSSFIAATFNQPARWAAKGGGFHFGNPALFVRALDQETLGQAVVTMASEMSGFWLRYYNSTGPSNAGAHAPIVSSISVIGGTPEDPRRGSAVVEAALRDGRIFSILAATPLWFEEEARKLNLAFYFGPSILFLEETAPALAGRAAEAMAASGDQWLCRYDTPRKTLTEVLAEFKARRS